MKDPVVVVADRPEVVTIKNIILDNLETIDKTKADLKNAREMMTNALENDDKYRSSKETEGKARRERQAVEETIKNQNPTVTDKIEDLKETLKEAQEAVSDYLAEFVRLTGKMEIEKRDGTQMRIVRKFKVSPGQQKMF